MELMQLLPAVKDNDFYIVTEKNIASTVIVEKYKHHYLVQQERKSLREAWVKPSLRDGFDISLL